mgnify:CR=1 FL=1
MDQPGTLDALKVETRVFRPLPHHVIEANLTPGDYEAARERALADPLGYWDEAARELSWFRQWDETLDSSRAPFYSWYSGGLCNISYNCLDRHVDSPLRNKLALIWEGERGEVRKFTYFELLREVRELSRGLKSLGVGKGDRVILYMPPLPETVIGMLACARIGASHCLVFAGFSAKVLRARIEDAAAKAVLTTDGFFRGGRETPLKPQVDQALAGPGASTVETVIVVSRTGAQMEMTDGRDIPYNDLILLEKGDCPVEPMESGDELFTLYSSGSTGEPRGVVHGHGGYMVGVYKTMQWVLDVKPTDVIWCMADPAWITGHSYAVYGPLLAGATSLIHEGKPFGRNNVRALTIIERHGVTELYVTPTIIRTMRRFGGQPAKGRDLSSLRLMLTAGEPISPEDWIWFHKTMGRGECPLLDAWWQTETGMMMLTPLPISLLKPGSVGKPLPGVFAEVVDRTGRPVAPGKGGFLVLTHPWPAMFQGLLNDPDGYRKTYWETIPGAYWAGDMARLDEDGAFWIQGRADDVLNIAGRRIGNAELENALISHKAVAEAAVIGVPDPISGEAAKAFITPSERWEEKWSSEEALIGELVEHIRRELGPIASIRAFAFRDALPKTGSGKLDRRALKIEEAAESAKRRAGLGAAGGQGEGA